MLLLRGDHALNEIKAPKLPGLAGMRLATEAEIRTRDRLPAGLSSGRSASDASIPVIADRSVARLADFVCGANEADFHLAGVNFGRDLPRAAIVADIRNVVAGDPSPGRQGQPRDLSRHRSRPYLPAAHEVFGSHERRLSRRGGQAANHGDGLLRHRRYPHRRPPRSSRITTRAASSFRWRSRRSQVAVVPIGTSKKPKSGRRRERLHDELAAAGIEVLLDDRDERPGVMFADMELIGIPHRIVVGERGLAAGQVEFKGRQEDKAEAVAVDEVVDYTRARIVASR